MNRNLTLAHALALVSLTALLAGCNTTSQVEVVQSIPDDYRQRHPIAVREKVQSMTVFIGDARGTLTPTQRAEVGGLAARWRQPARSGSRPAFRSRRRLSLRAASSSQVRRPRPAASA